MECQTCHSVGVEALKQCHPQPLPVHRLEGGSANGLRPAYLWCLNSIRFLSDSYVGAFRLAWVTFDNSYSLPGVRSLNLVVAEFVGSLILSSQHLEPSFSVRLDCSRSASGTSPAGIPKEPL